MGLGGLHQSQASQPAAIISLEMLLVFPQVWSHGVVWGVDCAGVYSQRLQGSGQPARNRKFCEPLPQPTSQLHTNSSEPAMVTACAQERWAGMVHKCFTVYLGETVFQCYPTALDSGANVEWPDEFNYRASL